LYGISNIKSRVEEIVNLTGLVYEANKKIAALSKGYRQRVGLAQALVHDPPVLILDEPTSGLDPNQLAEIRALIRTLGKTKTVIFSTHIMQEVQSVCDRVIILNNGQLVVDKPIGFLSEVETGGQVVVVQFDRRVLLPTLEALPGIVSAVESRHTVYRVVGQSGVDIRPLLFKFAVDKSAAIIEMYAEKSSVEDVFRQFTKREAEV
jgi:ABC-2 type transport system ATP-binding protein